MAERTRVALNQLMGVSENEGPASPARVRAPPGLLRGPPRLSRSGGVDDVQPRCWARLLASAGPLLDARRAHWRTGVDPKVAIFKTSPDEYNNPDGFPSAYLPFVGHMIAEPPLGGGIRLDRWLDGADARLMDIDVILKDAAEVEATLRHENRCFDKVLGRREEYVRYLCRADVRPLWVLRRAEESKATCSLAAVAKSTGDMLRKILMVVPFNCALRALAEVLGAEPQYGMGAAGALGQVSCAEDLNCTATLDQGNAFTEVFAPESWWPYQCGPRVRARELPRPEVDLATRCANMRKISDENYKIS